MAEAVGAAARFPEGRDPGPLARLEDVKRDAGAPDAIFQLLCEGRSLTQIKQEWRLPGKFVQWFMQSHPQLYEDAHKVRTDWLVNEALAKASGADDPKLHVDTNLKVAEKWDRPRYGPSVKVEHSAHLVVDAGLLGTIGELLERRREKVIEAQPDVDLAEELKPVKGADYI